MLHLRSYLYFSKELYHVIFKLFLDFPAFPKGILSYCRLTVF